MTEELMNELKKDYSYLMEVPNRGLCGISPMLYTVGIVYGMDETSYEGRYCYETAIEAVIALHQWDGAGDPPGNWIVNKSRRNYDRWNPNRK